MTTNQPAPGLFIERTGTRQYRSENSRGATIEIGQGLGQWSPGDLLKLALLGCNAMSSDSRLERVLGPDFTLGGGISGTYNEAEDRYEDFSVELLPDFGDLSDEEVAALTERALKAIERNCTIGRTIDHVVPHTTLITRED